MLRRLISIGLLFLLMVNVSFAASFPSLPYNFQPRQLIASAKVMSNYNALLNGLIDGTKKVNVNELWVNGTRVIDSSRNMLLQSVTVTGNITTSANFIVVGIITANAFVGDGAGITNIPTVITGNSAFGAAINAPTNSVYVQQNGNVSINGTLFSSGGKVITSDFSWSDQGSGSGGVTASLAFGNNDGAATEEALRLTVTGNATTVRGIYIDHNALGSNGQTVYINNTGISASDIGILLAMGGTDATAIQINQGKSTFRDVSLASNTITANKAYVNTLNANEITFRTPTRSVTVPTANLVIEITLSDGTTADILLYQP